MIHLFKKGQDVSADSQYAVRLSPINRYLIHRAYTTRGIRTTFAIRIPLSFLCIINTLTQGCTYLFFKFFLYRSFIETTQADQNCGKSPTGWIGLLQDREVLLQFFWWFWFLVSSPNTAAKDTAEKPVQILQTAQTAFPCPPYRICKIPSRDSKYSKTELLYRFPFSRQITTMISCKNKRIQAGAMAAVNTGLKENALVKSKCIKFVNDLVIPHPGHRKWNIW